MYLGGELASNDERVVPGAAAGGAAARTTLEDVARRSGVSLATASRALNDRDGVRADVRQRVLRAAAEIGYRPNRSARNLAIGRSSVIGLVIPSSDLWHDPYSAYMTHAVARAANRADQGLMLVLDSDAPGGTVRHILRDGLIDGLVISAVAAGEAWVEELLSADLPNVLIGHHPTRSDVDVVDVENLQSSVRLVEHLFEHGGDRVATVTGPLDRVDAATRLAGYRLAHERRGLAVDERLVLHGDFDRASGTAAGAAIVELRPDAVFAANDEMAVGLIQAVTAAGLDVPGDLAIAGFDGTADPSDGISVTSMRQPFDAIATAAVEELLARIDGQAPQRLTLINPELVVGTSTSPTYPPPATSSTPTRPDAARPP